MISLSMIVRNEAHCIERCLKSVKPFIDQAVIIDTGSEDGTQELISECLHDVHHYVMQRPWVDFGHNRTEALSFNKQSLQAGRHHDTWSLLLDADETFEPDSLFMVRAFKYRTLRHDVYYAWHHMHGGRYARPFLLWMGRDWSWQGVLHEYIQEEHKGTILEDCHIQDHFDSKRNQQGMEAKCLADAELLQTQPLTPRNVFYIAEGYRGARQYDKALHWYEHRYFISESGWDQERWYAAFMIAGCMDKLQRPFNEVVRAYVIACDTRPSRAETYVEFSKYLYSKGREDLARVVFEKAKRLPMTTDTLNVNPTQYPAEFRAHSR